MPLSEESGTSRSLMAHGNRAMAFVQDLRQAIADRFKLDKDTRGVRQAWSKGSMDNSLSCLGRPLRFKNFWSDFCVFVCFNIIPNLEKKIETYFLFFNFFL